MDTVLAPSAHLWQLNSQLIPKALDGLSQEELLRRPSPETSPMLWIFGHVTNSRCGVANLLGGSHEFPWQDLFSRGSRVEDDGRYPAAEEMQRVWRRATEDLLRRLEEASGDVLSQAAPRDFPVPDKTIRGAVNFLAFHEGYHVGQMALLRKWLGKGALVG